MVEIGGSTLPNEVPYAGNKPKKLWSTNHDYLFGAMTTQIRILRPCLRPAAIFFYPFRAIFDRLRTVCLRIWRRFRGQRMGLFQTKFRLWTSKPANIDRKFAKIPHQFKMLTIHTSACSARKNTMPGNILTWLGKSIVFVSSFGICWWKHMEPRLKWSYNFTDN